MTAAFNLSQLANNLNTSGQLDATDGLTGLLPIANGGTNASTAATAFSNIKQAATTSATGVVELATSAEAAAGTDATRAITPSTLFGGLNATGTAPIYACRAWIKFSGSTGAISNDGNVTSVTDNGTGDFTINFTTAIVDANYSWVASTKPTSSQTNDAAVKAVYANPTVGPTTSALRLVTAASSFGRDDFDFVYVAVFR